MEELAGVSCPQAAAQLEPAGETSEPQDPHCQAGCQEGDDSGLGQLGPP